MEKKILCSQLWENCGIEEYLEELFNGEKIIVGKRWIYEVEGEGREIIVRRKEIENG